MFVLTSFFSLCFFQIWGGGSCGVDESRTGFKLEMNISSKTKIITIQKKICFSKMRNHQWFLYHRQSRWWILIFLTTPWKMIMSKSFNITLEGGDDCCGHWSCLPCHWVHPRIFPQVCFGHHHCWHYHQYHHQNHHHHNKMIIGTPQPSVLHGKEFKSKCYFKHCSLDEALSYWEVS